MTYNGDILFFERTDTKESVENFEFYDTDFLSDSELENIEKELLIFETNHKPMELKK